MDYSHRPYTENLITHPHALPTKDALIQVTVEERIAGINRERPFRSAERQFGNT
ncbi:hypothetical protein ES703_112344 [subsurface metagenome]